jgi:CHAD domain-containing protein
VPAPESNREREVKLDAPVSLTLPDLTAIVAGVVATPLPDANLQAIYVDTADLRLMRWGVTLRHRHDAVGGAGAESGWTVKLPGKADGVALVRTELSWPGPFGPVPAEVASLVRALARGGRLEPVATLVSERHRVELRASAGAGDGNNAVDGTKLGEIDDDTVSVTDGGRLVDRFRQIELEVTDAASDELLDAVLGALIGAGAVAGDDRPKVVRAIGPRAADAPDVVVAPLDGDATVAAVVAAAIGAGVTRIIRHDPGVRLGDDPEHVHQARVGTRRLRSDLRTFRPLLAVEWTRSVRAELGWLADALGEVRDADVLTGRLRDQTRTLDGADSKAAAALLRRLAIERDEARLRLLVALDSDRYVALLDDLVRAANVPPLAPGVEGDRKAAKVLVPLVRRPWKQLAQFVADLPDDPPGDSLHQVRIRAKRVRYAAESVATVIGKPARELATAVAAVQGVLGDMHDSVVAERWLRRQGTSGPASRALVAGQLVMLQRHEQAAGREKWRQPWHRAAKKKRRRWLKA